MEQNQMKPDFKKDDDEQGARPDGKEKPLRTSIDQVPLDLNILGHSLLRSRSESIAPAHESRMDMGEAAGKASTFAVYLSPVARSG